MMPVALAAAAEAAVSLPWSQLGAGGLLAIAIVLILTGRLVSRGVADKWESAYREERALNREEIDRLSEVTEELGRTTVALLHSIKEEAPQPDKQGGG
jgi:hypothetical protein